MASYCSAYRLALPLYLAAALLYSAMAASPGKAGEANADEIIRALKGPKTRSLIRPRQDVEAFEQLKEIRKTRGPTLQEREKLYEASKGLPQTDLTIFFNFDSDEILPSSMRALNEVAKALKSEELRGRSFVIAGHTDRKGAPDYNVDLSLRRAEAVKRALVKLYGIDADTLTTIGFGFDKLANKNDPYASENRRVQFVKWND